jgi:uncharacterized membrane protein YphA (DoxX/SURF4 family)
MGGHRAPGGVAVSERGSRVARILRCGLGGVLIYAGISKLPDSLSFADSIASYRILPSILITPLALALPPFEALIGLLLIAGKYTRPALLAAGLLFTAFLVALAQAWLRNLPIDCGCFGPSGDTPPWLAVLRDLVLLSVAICLYSREVVTSSRVSAPGGPASSQ